jgi:hypothetical protein
MLPGSELGPGWQFRWKTDRIRLPEWHKFDCDLISAICSTPSIIDAFLCHLRMAWSRE